MERRTALKLLAGGALATELPLAAQHAHLVQIAMQPQDYKLLFFSDQENKLLDVLSEMILPADERSGGAHEAKVSLYIDLVVAHSEEPVQQRWRSALKAADEQAQSRFHKTFLECDAASRDALLAEWARGEAKPQTELETFFVDLKRQTAAGYYSTEVGLLKELGYVGNVALSEFPGCQHPENYHT
jgi:glucoside 3-dehydrogenase (cytochrome c) hitch-hiker subunit